MTSDQFAKARTAICTSDQVRSHAEHSDAAGCFATSQVAMDYNYAAGVLTLDVTARHGMARLANDEHIREKLLYLLAKV
jgi:hypothetical protein